MLDSAREHRAIASVRRGDGSGAPSNAWFPSVDARAADDQRLPVERVGHVPTEITVVSSFVVNEETWARRLVANPGIAPRIWRPIARKAREDARGEVDVPDGFVDIIGHA
ncbi:MAG: hypothetical protein AMS18_01550 [Gemmatimonas sp. SG8_17]|nr:MAG: hypothetical protein AMS18_01550 [Gemmatimonas sp. SG8_17]